MTPKQHAHAISRFASAALPVDTRSRRELAGVVTLIDEGLRDDAETAARATGVRELIEAARNEHLAGLDADEGLRALLVPWEEVALLVGEMHARVYRRR